VLQYERRTITGETDTVVSGEIAAILDRLRAADPEFQASARLATSRPPYRVSDNEPVVRALASSLGARGLDASPTGMSFWTDAAILAGAGMPSVLFGPGGAGLHSIEEYVNVADVEVCRDVLMDVATRIMLS